MANDYWRQNVASLLSAAIVGVLIGVRIVYEGEDFVGNDSAAVSEVVVTVALAGWVSFCVTYCWLTHRTFSRMSPTKLCEQAEAAARHKERWWHAFLGTMDSAGWTVYGASIATVLVMILAQNGYIREEPIYVFLGLAVAGGSWVLMAYSYALTYMRAHASGAAIEFPFDDAPVFGDYLSHSVFVSTFLGPQARVRSRDVLTGMRTHALLAFMFNAVVVAMTVSLLFGTLTG